MAITYDSTYNKLFLDPDLTTEDTFYTLDDIVTAFPAVVTKENQTYFFSCSLVVGGTDTSRAELKATSSILYFTNGCLGNDGGRLILGEKGSNVDGEYTKDGCLVLLDGNDSAYGSDPYRTLTADRASTEIHPLCAMNGEVFAYDTKFNYINGSDRSDMLDVASDGSEIEMIDCHFDGNVENGAHSAYTHLFLTNCYFENVKISDFGTFELRYQTTRDWVGVTLIGSLYGVSIFMGDVLYPVRLKNLSLRGITYIGKKPSNSHLELIDLDYPGTNRTFSLTNGTCKLLTSTNVTSVYAGVATEGARVVLTSGNDNISFDMLTNVDGVIDTQEVLTEYSSDGSTTFDIQENPFIFHAYQYGKIPIEIPMTINPPNETNITASFIADLNITKTALESEAINVDLVANVPSGLITDPGFDVGPFPNDLTITATGLWGMGGRDEDTEIYVENGVVFMTRNWATEWNDGKIVYQNIDCVIGQEYSVGIRVNKMGGATKVRVAIFTYKDFTITDVGSYVFTFVATATSHKVGFNTDPSYYSDHTEIEYFSVYDASSSGLYPVDPDGNEYQYTVNCNGASINDVLHKLHYLWSVTDGQKITTQIASGLDLDGSGAYHGGKGIMFSDYNGFLSTTTGNDGTIYHLPIVTLFTISGLQPGSIVEIYDNEIEDNGNNNTKLSYTNNSGTSFSYSHDGVANDIRVQVLKDGYVERMENFTLGSVDQVLSMNQEVDKNY